MTTSRSRGTAAVLAATAVAALSLTGCSTLQQALQHESTARFADASALASDWDKTADWLPEDATAISVHESTDGAPASLLATSDAELDLTRCAEVERQSAPTFSIEDTPDVYTIDTVFACGDWAVVPTDDGWYGWTPNDPDERAASPAR